MPPRQPGDLGQRVVHALRVERSTALEERVLVAEVAVLRTSARDDDRVRHEVAAAIDEIAPNGRQPVERAIRGRAIDARGTPRAKVREELREGLLAGPEEHRVGVRRRLVGQRRHVQAAERDEDAFRPVVVGDAVGAARVGDVDLDDDEVGRVVGVERRDVLVHQHRLVVGPEIGRERGQAERREQRVFDRTPVRAGGLGQRRQDELHAQRTGHRIASGA